MTTLYLATRNPGKIREFNRILESLPGGIRAATPDASMPEVEENGVTFEANARLKAEALSSVQKGWVVADDSGLVVDALGGEPGIRSARYGEPEVKGLDDAGRVRLLLDRMRDVPEAERTARFVCLLAVAREGKVEVTFEGTSEGLVAHEPAGGGGFGYDPVIRFPGADRTFGELLPEEKDRFSHRGQALWRLAAWFSERDAGARRSR